MEHPKGSIEQILRLVSLARVQYPKSLFFQIHFYILSANNWIIKF